MSRSYWGKSGILIEKDTGKLIERSTMVGNPSDGQASIEIGRLYGAPIAGFSIKEAGQEMRHFTAEDHETSFMESAAYAKKDVSWKVKNFHNGCFSEFSYSPSMEELKICRDGKDYIVMKVSSHVLKRIFIR